MKMKKLASITLAMILAVTTLAGCNFLNKSNVIYADEDGYAEGGLGDTMHTAFFEYTVNSAYTCTSYGDYVPEDGNQLLVAEITVKNVFNESIEMYDMDFQVQWNDTSEDAYDWPVTAYMSEGETIDDDMLPDTYELGIRESRTGNLVYEVPAGQKDFSISYQTYYADDTTGDLFFVYFTARSK